jgi:hypothetical protein
MTAAVEKQQTRLLVVTELRQFFVHPRGLHTLPLIAAGVMLVLWSQFTFPVLAVVLVTFVALEPQFNNVLFRTRSEFEAMSMLPVDWQMIIKAKNIAAMILYLMVLPLVAAILFYFSPNAVTPAQIIDGVAYLLTVFFPLLHIGNMRSLQHPRRRTGWQTDDLGGAVELIISAAIVSLPYAFFIGGLESRILCFAYALAGSLFWWYYSIAKTALLIESRRTDLCKTH